MFEIMILAACAAVYAAMGNEKTEKEMASKEVTKDEFMKEMGWE